MTGKSKKKPKPTPLKTHQSPNLKKPGSPPPPSPSQPSSSLAKKTGKFPLVAIVTGVMIIVIAVVLLFIVRPFQKTTSPASGMNLLFITLDTTRADRIGAYGYKGAMTPHIDALAGQGIVMENCYTPAPLTLPAHCSMFTGKYPIGHQARDNGMYVLRPEETTLAEILKTQEYHTFAVISSFVLLGKFGLEQGFDDYDDSLHSHKMYNNYTSEIPATFVFRKYQQWFQQNYHKRFFAWVHLYDPHAPYVAPKRIAERFKDDFNGKYDAEIAFADECVGKIIAGLREKNILDNTLIVIVGDHGEAFGEHEEFGHGIFCYDEVLKVPLIIYNPRVFPTPVRVANRVNLIDILPTLLELYGIDGPAGIQGSSFISLVANNSREKPRSFYFESLHGKHEMDWAPLTGIIDGDYKYIALPERELYNLQADPGEKENLYWKKNLIAKNMDKKLLEQMKKFAGIGGDSRREMTQDDRDQLQTLGYVSSNPGQATPNQDPKKGIILDNKIKEIFRIMGENKLEEARRAMENLKTQYPDIRLPVYFDMQVQLYEKQKDIDGAIGVLKEALEKYPQIDRFYIIYAFKLNEKGETEAAAEACHKLLQLNPRFTRAYILLGEIEESKRNMESALDFYQKALQIEPQNISLKLKLAEIKIMKREFLQAMEIYDQLLERQEVSQNAGLLFKIGALHFQGGNLERAEKLLRQAVAIKPRGDYFYNLAILLNKRNKNEEALENMRIAIEEHPQDLNPRKIEMGQKAMEMWKKKN